MKRSGNLELVSFQVHALVMTKKEMVKKLERAYACEDYFPGVLGNPVVFAARWGLPLSRSYRKFKQQELRALKRQLREAARKKNGKANGRQRIKRKQGRPSKRAR